MDKNPVYRQLTPTASFGAAPDIDIGFRATGMMVVLDQGTYVEWSFDGRTVHGKVTNNDGSITFDQFDFSKLWFRGPTNASLRFWAWLRQK